MIQRQNEQLKVARPSFTRLELVRQLVEVIRIKYCQVESDQTFHKRNLSIVQLPNAVGNK